MLLGRPCHTLLRSFSLSLLLSPLALAEGPPPAEVSVEVVKPELLSVVLDMRRAPRVTEKWKYAPR